MRISDWSSDVCSSDLQRWCAGDGVRQVRAHAALEQVVEPEFVLAHRRQVQGGLAVGIAARGVGAQVQQQPVGAAVLVQHRPLQQRHALVVDRVGVGAGRDQFACQPVVAVADRGGELGVVGIGESLAVVQVVSFSGASGHRRQHKRSQQQRRDRPAVPEWSRDEGVGTGSGGAVRGHGRTLHRQATALAAARPGAQNHFSGLSLPATSEMPWPTSPTKPDTASTPSPTTSATVSTTWPVPSATSLTSLPPPSTKPAMASNGVSSPTSSPRSRSMLPPALAAFCTVSPPKPIRPEAASPMVSMLPSSRLPTTSKVPSTTSPLANSSRAASVIPSMVSPAFPRTSLNRSVPRWARLPNWLRLNSPTFSSASRPTLPVKPITGSATLPSRSRPPSTTLPRASPVLRTRTPAPSSALPASQPPGNRIGLPRSTEPVASSRRSAPWPMSEIRLPASSPRTSRPSLVAAPARSGAVGRLAGSYGVFSASAST